MWSLPVRVQILWNDQQYSTGQLCINFSAILRVRNLPYLKCSLQIYWWVHMELSERGISANLLKVSFHSVKRLARYQRKHAHKTRFFAFLLREFPLKTAISCRVVSSKFVDGFDEVLVQSSTLWSRSLWLLGCNMREFSPLQSYCSAESPSSAVFSPFCTRVKWRGRAYLREFRR